MDDLQFRRSLYADPKHIDADMQQAINNDAQKQKFANELNKLEQDITSALSVDVPEGLADKLILRQTMASHRQQKRKSRIQLALAASVVFAIGLTMNFFQFSSAYNSLSDHALAHVYHEEGRFQNIANSQLTLASLNQKMSTFGGQFNQLIGDIIAADYCRFDGIKSLHLVFKGEHSPITVFVIPHDENLSVAHDFFDEKFQGKTIQYLHSNIVVVTEKDEQIAQWQNKISQNIQWTI
ncbi:DUF3379 family protein [Thalassotalea agariperforans]